MTNDSAVAKIGSGERHRQSVQSPCPFCDQMTWAWTPAGNAKPESKNVIMSMMIHVQAMPENVKTQLLDLALHDMQLRQRKARILLGRVRDLDPRVAKCFLLKSAPAARFVLRFAHPVFSMNDSSTLIGTKTQDEFDYPLGLLRNLAPSAHHDAGRMPKASSFIAVSYCWHDPSWQLAESLTDIGSPLTLEMWRLILRLRQSDEESIWIDQLCIRQDDEKGEAGSHLLHGSDIPERSTCLDRSRRHLLVGSRCQGRWGLLRLPG